MSRPVQPMHARASAEGWKEGVWRRGWAQQDVDGGKEGGTAGKSGPLESSRGCVAEEQLEAVTEPWGGGFAIECVAVMPLGEDEDVWAVGGVGRGGLGEGEGMRVWSGGVDGRLRSWRVPDILLRPPCEA